MNAQNVIVSVRSQAVRKLHCRIVHRNVWDGNLFFQWKVARSKYASYAYDATWTYALALDKLLKEKPSRYQNLHGDDATT